MFVKNEHPETYTVVNHLNEIKTDNRAENLEWTTPSKNVLYSLETGGNKYRGENSPNTTMTNETAEKICEMISSGYRIFEISNTLGVSQGVISNIKSGKNWTHISSKYDFSKSFKAYVTNEEAENILQLRESGKGYKEISEITGRSITAITKVLKDYNKLTGVKRKVVTTEARSKTTWSIILLYEHGLTIDEISKVLGVTKSKIENTICFN